MEHIVVTQLQVTIIGKNEPKQIILLRMPERDREGGGALFEKTTNCIE